MGFSRGLRLLSAQAPAAWRGEVTSAYFVGVYLGIPVPIVLVRLGAGVLLRTRRAPRPEDARA